MPLSTTAARARVTWLPIWAALALAAAIIGLDRATLPPGVAITREHGGVELASALLYVFAAGVWLRVHPRTDWRRFWHLPAVMMAMAGREFDLDKSLTSVGLLKSNLYLTDQAPLWERALGVTVLALLALILVRLLRLNGRAFLSGLKAGDRTAWAVAAGIAVAVAAKSLDGLARKLEPFGVIVPDATSSCLGSIEEVMELFIPFLFLYAILAAARRRDGAR